MKYGKKEFNIIGLFEAMADIFNKPKAVPWGIKAKEKDAVLKPTKAPAAKKKHRKMVGQSRQKNRGK